MKASPALEITGSGGGSSNPSFSRPWTASAMTNSSSALFREIYFQSCKHWRIFDFTGIARFGRSRTIDVMVFINSTVAICLIKRMPAFLKQWSMSCYVSISPQTKTTQHTLKPKSCMLGFVCKRRRFSSWMANSGVTSLALM